MSSEFKSQLGSLWLQLLVAFSLSISPCFGDSLEETSVQTNAPTQDSMNKGEIVAQSVNTATPAPTLEKLPTGPLSPSGLPTTAEMKVGQTTVTVGGGGFFLHRKNFRLIQPQNERELVSTQTVGDPFEYDLEGVGSFGNVAIEHPVYRDFSVGVSFLGSTLEKNQFRPVPGGSSTRGGPSFISENTSVIPLLNKMGQETVPGSAVEIGAKPNDSTALSDTNFTYNTEQYDLALDLIRESLYTRGDFRLDGLVGFGYTRVNQHTDLHTKGVDIFNSGVSQSDTAEYLRDNLFGGRFGVRIGAKIAPMILLRTSIIGGLFSDSIRYVGNQDFDNSSGAEIGLPANLEVRQILAASRFVPRLDTRNSLVFQFTPNFSMEVSYLFNSFWNLSTVDHPTVVFKNHGSAGIFPLPPVPFGLDEIDHEVRIGSETVTQHFVELRLALKF